jgi:hypothetical protein
LPVLRQRFPQRIDLVGVTAAKTMDRFEHGRKADEVTGTCGIADVEGREPRHGHAMPGQPAALREFVAHQGDGAQRVVMTKSEPVGDSSRQFQS